MIAYRMLYAVAVGVPIALAAWVVAGALRRHGRPERAVWLGGLVLAVLLPVALMTGPFDALRVPSGGSVEVGDAQAHVDREGDPQLQLPTLVVVRSEGSGSGLDTVLLAAWLVASLGLALRWAVSQRRLARISSDWRAGTVDGSDVWITPDAGPAVTGALRARVLVPEWLLELPGEQQSLVLLHEDEHVRAGDPALMTVSRIARILTPWNPVVWVLTSRLLRAVETDCDRRVLRRRPDVRKYCDTLFAISARRPSRLVGAAAFAEPLVPLQKRILAMTTPSRSLSALTMVAIAAAGAVLVVGSCGVPLPTERDADPRSSVLDFPGALRVVVLPDGSVLLNDEPHPMSEVTEVAAGLVAASPDPLVTVINVGDDVPYRFVTELQERLRAADAIRVVMRGDVAEATGFRSDPFSIVLPEAGWSEPETVSQRNLLKLHVLASGQVEVRRGEAVQVQLLRAQGITPLWRQEVASNPELIAVVSADWDTTYPLVLAVLDALHSANAGRISLKAVTAQ